MLFGCVQKYTHYLSYLKKGKDEVLLTERKTEQQNISVFVSVCLSFALNGL